MINVDAVGHVAQDGVTIQVVAHVHVKELDDDDGAPKIPIFRQRRTSALGIKLYDGQTLVLDAGVIQVDKNGKTPVLGPSDVPLVGRLFPGIKHKRLLFFITPTIIDPAGNPIHNEQRNEIPPQINK